MAPLLWFLLVLDASGAAQRPDASTAIRNNLLFATVSIDDKGDHSLILDTGASATAVLDERLGRKLHLHAPRTITLGGGGSDNCKAAVTNPLSLTVSGKRLQAVGLNLLDLSPIERLVGRPVEGVIGGRLFNNYAVALDFATARAVVLAKGAYNYPGFTAIPISSSQGLCCLVELHLSIASRQLRGRFLIDTGAPSIDVALAPRFLQDNNILPAASAKTITLPTLCATSTLALYEPTAEVRIGTVTVPQVSLLLSLDRTGAFANGGFDGIIGGVFLRRFHKAVVDVPNGRLLLKSPPE